jgi:uncharacterized protein DUF87
MSSTPDEQRSQLLNLGNVISKGDEVLDEPFFLEDLDEEQEQKSLEPFQVSANLIATGRTCVIGSSGSGKSYTVGVICEELCKCRVPFVIVDIEGEYSGLKEKYEVIWIGDEDNCDLKWSTKFDIRLLSKYAPDCPPIILDLSEAIRPREKVNEFLISAYREVSRRRTPYLVILEEADRFCPQSGGERLPIFDEIARRGRKRGLGLMLCTQRPSLVDKNILSQCSNQLIGKMVIKNDLSSVAQFFSGHGQPTQLTELKPGEFFALGGLAPQPEKVKIRERETRHGGITPKLNPTAIRPSVENILEWIRSGTTVSIALREESSGLHHPSQILKDEEMENSMVGEEKADSMAESPKPNIVAQDYEIQKATSSQDMVSIPSEQDGKEVGMEKPVGLNMESVLDWENDLQSKEIVGLAPLLEPEAVPKIVRLGRMFVFFGQKENITQVGLAFRPLVQLGVRIRTGLVKRKFETKYFSVDGISGKLVDITDRLGFRDGIEKLLGLQESQIVVLKALSPERPLSLIEVASAANRTSDETRRLLKELESKRLVRSSRRGRYIWYSRLVDFPRIELGRAPLLKLNELNVSEGFKIAKLKIKEEQVREVVKGLWVKADLESFKQIYYPVYLAELMLNERKRYVWIDGRTGKEIEM